MNPTALGYENHLRTVEQMAAGALARARRWQGALEVFEELVSRQKGVRRLEECLKVLISGHTTS